MISRLMTSMVLSGACLLLVGCAASRYEVVTEPAGMDLSYVTYNGVEKTLGKTPYSIRPNEIADSQDAFVQVILKNPEYRSRSMIIPKSLTGSDNDIRVKMDRLDSAKVAGAECTNKGDGVDLGDLARGIAEAQTLLMQKDLVQAESRLQILSAKYPQVSVVHDLYGNLFYLKRDTARALKSYKRSLELWPHNTETKRMVENLEKASGG